MKVVVGIWRASNKESVGVDNSVWRRTVLKSQVESQIETKNRKTVGDALKREHPPRGGWKKWRETEMYAKK